MYLSSVSSRLLLYDTNNWELKYCHGKSDGIIRDVSWSDDSKYILLVNPKGTAEILSPASHNLVLQHIPIDDSCAACFQRDGHRNIAVGTTKGEVIIWDAKNKEKTKIFPTLPSYAAVDFLSFNAKNTNLAASMQNGDTVIYGLVSNIPISTVKLNCSKSISAMKFHHEARSLLGLATDEGHVILKDVSVNKDKVTFENSHASPVSDFVYSLINRDVMLSCGLDKNLQVYDIKQRNVVSTLKTPHALTSLAINGENQVALGTQKGYVLLYDLRDLTTPLKILKGHNNKVKKVAFQPPRKKFMSPELSLVDKLDTNSPNIESPIQNNSLDMLFTCNTPPNRLEPPARDVEDSFLFKMGMEDKTIEELEINQNRSLETYRKSDRNEFRLHQLDIENSAIQQKSSTPIINKTADNIMQNLTTQNGISEERASNSNSVPIKSNISVQNVGIDNKTIEELKDFFKLSLSYVADDNKNCFLHIMMALTKQKLYLEKQLSQMSNQLLKLEENQNELVEINRKLALEIDQLKSRHTSF
ncbi:uncharacterized protein LOC125063650 [Pieris napi]|uniref:uncharacterized protein LOC125063650 n=1 Tax=Pieris napi TaxID=78633 RepID=UPI001FBB977B|nr:uncharacterized protein LOC125063650 [Pieris napi]